MDEAEQITDERLKRDLTGERTRWHQECQARFVGEDDLEMRSYRYTMCMLGREKAYLRERIKRREGSRRDG